MKPPISIPPERHTLPAFFLLAFGISWAFWVPAALDSLRLISFPVPATFPLAAFGPSLAAITLIVLTKGLSGLRRLLGRLLVWRVNVLWYAFVLLFPAVVSLAATGLHVLFGGRPPDFADPPVLRVCPLPPELLAVGPLVLLPIVFLATFLIGSPMGEEIGWRGYALPKLQAARSAFTASVILGLLWGLWHLPRDLALGQLSFWSLPGIVAFAILFTWVYNNTGGSLLLALLFHASIAVTGLFLSGVEAPLLDLALQWAVVAAVVAVAGPRHLSRKAPVGQTGKARPEPARSGSGDAGDS